jgi:hypothetical protein
MTLPYSPITWVDNDPTYTEKLKAMTNNDQWLFENSPRMLYNAFGVKRTSQVKIASGVLVFPPMAAMSAGKKVYFGNFFTAGCRPVITTGMVYGNEYRIHVGMRGVDYTQFPDHRGFHVQISMDHSTVQKYNRLTRSCYLQWIACGY